MRHETRATSALPPQQVWERLVDVERWPDLISTYRSVRLLDGGRLAVGSRAHIVQVGLRPGDWQVTDLDEGRHFTWTSSQPGLRIVAWHRVEPAASGCQVTLGIEMQGPMSGLVRLLFGAKTRRYIDIELAAFTAGSDVPGR